MSGCSGKKREREREKITSEFDSYSRTFRSEVYSGEEVQMRWEMVEIGRKVFAGGGFAECRGALFH